MLTFNQLDTDLMNSQFGKYVLGNDEVSMWGISHPVGEWTLILNDGIVTLKLQEYTYYDETDDFEYTVLKEFTADNMDDVLAILATESDYDYQ